MVQLLHDPERSPLWSRRIYRRYICPRQNGGFPVREDLHGPGVHRVEDALLDGLHIDIARGLDARVAQCPLCILERAMVLQIGPKCPPHHLKGDESVGASGIVLVTGTRLSQFLAFRRVGIVEEEDNFRFDEKEFSVWLTSQRNGLT